MRQRALPRVFRSPAFQAALLLVLAVSVGNVNALVDLVLHPEIPYFDREHLLSGGVTAAVSAVLSFLLLRYMHRLGSAVETINRLETIVPICSNCKRIRTSGSGPGGKESWQSIESFVTQQTNASFSHGICPECAAALYPQYAREMHAPPSQPS